MVARASAVPAGGLATRARAALGIKQGAGNARSKDTAKRVPPRPRKPGLRLSPLRWKTPWGEEPWWNADRCAPLR